MDGFFRFGLWEVNEIEFEGCRELERLLALEVVLETYLFVFVEVVMSGDFFISRFSD